MLKIAILFLTFSAHAHADWDCYPGRGGEECTEHDPILIGFTCEGRVTASSDVNLPVGHWLKLEVGASSKELFVRRWTNANTNWELHAPLGNGGSRDDKGIELRYQDGTITYEFASGIFRQHDIELWPDYHATDVTAYCGSVLPFVTTH